MPILANIDFTFSMVEGRVLFPIGSLPFSIVSLNVLLALLSRYQVRYNERKKILSLIIVNNL